ncbi:hypothetical protein GIB67_000189 [Kingdonia uniflora]|uniref:Uncharacterized protein n=1 Tax=Kingdonia uniflora TaxID=39325 RepID=A0A7J7P9E7_9MAGN|nr:hypothetical protein GIB67_000189 [Kingdonia uniflora]
MSPSKPNKAANKLAKRQKTPIVDAKKTTKKSKAKLKKNVVFPKEEDFDDLPKVYHSDKEIDLDEIDDYEIKTPMNIVPESESECDDINEEQERWVRYAQVGIDCLGGEDGYYSTHSSDDEDYVPTAEDRERGNEFESVDVELDDIYSKEEDDKFKTPLTVGLKKLENYLNKKASNEERYDLVQEGVVIFTGALTKHLAKDDPKVHTVVEKLLDVLNTPSEAVQRAVPTCLSPLMYSKQGEDAQKLATKLLDQLMHIDLYGERRGATFGLVGLAKGFGISSWVAREVELLIRDVRAVTPRAIKARMKTKYGVEISYWTVWNGRQIFMESIVGSYAQGYHDLPSLCMEILKSNPESIART